MSENKTPTIEQLEHLKQTQSILAAASQLVGEATYPGHYARVVDKVMTFFDKMHKQVSADIEAMQKVSEAEEVKSE